MLKSVLGMKQNVIITEKSKDEFSSLGYDYIMFQNCTKVQYPAYNV